MNDTPKEDLREWIIQNYECVTDDICAVSRKHAIENNWSEIEVDIMVEEISEKIKEGILNVVDTYKEA